MIVSSGNAILAMPLDLYTKMDGKRQHSSYKLINKLSPVEERLFIKKKN